MVAFGVLDQLDERAHRFVAERLDRLVDGGQWRVGEGRFGNVVEAHDGEVVGDRDAELGRGAHRLDGREVVGREDGRRTIGDREQLAGRRLGRLLGEPADAYEVGVEGDAGGFERRPVPGLASARRFEVGTAGQEGDPPVAEPDEVLGDGHRAFEVLRVDRRELRAAHVRVDRDDGLVRVDVDDRRRDEDRAVGECAAEPGHVATFPALCVVLAGGVDDHLEVRVVERLGRALEQLGAERLDVGDEDADHARALAAQAPCDEARLVAEVVDDGLHPAEGVGRDAVPAVDDAGDGRDRHAGALGDIADGDPERFLRHVERPPTVACSTRRAP